MALVRMTHKGVPKFIRTDGVTRISVDEDCVRVDYGFDELDYVDGTPDEVHKALFQPPETIEKAKVDEAISTRRFAGVQAMTAREEDIKDAIHRWVEKFRHELGLPPEKH